MDDPINQSYRDKKLMLQQELSQIPDDELNAMIQQKQKQTLGSRIGAGVMGGAETLGDILLRRGGVAMPQQQNDLNALMMREYVKSAFKPEKEVKEPTFSQVVSNAKKKLSQGMTLEDLDEEEQNALEMAAPKIVEQFTPIEASPIFKKPTMPGIIGKLQSFRNPNVAQISPKAQKMINQIKTMRDFNNFTKEVDNKIADGAFTLDEKNQVLEYFGKRG